LSVGGDAVHNFSFGVVHTDFGGIAEAEISSGRAGRRRSPPGSGAAR